MREKWNKKLNICTYCVEHQYPVESCNHFRGGKTRREHADGTWLNRFANRALRVAWQQDSHCDNKNFPAGACNGQKNRFG